MTVIVALVLRIWKHITSHAYQDIAAISLQTAVFQQVQKHFTRS